MLAAILFFVLLLAVVIAYLMTLNNTLETIDRKNRETEPSSVWLMFIPLYNLIYQFILYRKLTNSITAEYRSRGVKENAEVSYHFGVAFAVCVILNRLVSYVPEIGDMLDTIVSFASLATWIIFWVQINNHRRRILQLRRNTDNDSLIFGNQTR